MLLCEDGFEPNSQIWNPRKFSRLRPIFGLGSSQTLQAQQRYWAFTVATRDPKGEGLCIIPSLFTHARGVSVPIWLFVPLIILFESIFENLLQHNTKGKFLACILSTWICYLLISLGGRALYGFSNFTSVMNHLKTGLTSVVPSDRPFL